MAGRGGAFAAGGGEAAGAGRAGGTVGIADFGTGFGDVAERAAVADVVVGAETAALDDAPGCAEGRLASADVAETGFAAAAGRVADAVVVVEPAARVGTAVGPAADVGAVAGAVDPGATEAAPDAEATVDPRAGPEPIGVGPVGVAAVFACAAGRFVAAAACPEVGFVAGVDVLAAGGVGSGDDAAARGDLREPEADVEVAADASLAAAESVGGAGASPEPRSLVSSIGEAHVPEYAASAGAAAQEPELDVEPLVEAPVEALGALDVPDAFGAAFRAAGLAAWAGSLGTGGVVAADLVGAAALAGVAAGAVAATGADAGTGGEAAASVCSSFNSN